MGTKIIMAILLAIGLAGTVHAQKQQKTGSVTASQSALQTTTSCSWERVNDRTYSCERFDEDLGQLHVRLWHSPKGHVQFTAILTCPANTDLVGVVSWKEGESWAYGDSCSGRRMGMQLPNGFEKQLHPLPRVIEAIRVKPTPQRLPAEKLT